MRNWLGQTAGGLPRTFWYLWTGTLINRSGAFVMLFLEIHMVAHYGFSATFAGLVLGLFGGGMAIGSLIGGVLADRWGRRRTLLASNVLLAITAILLGLSMQPVIVAVLAATFGLWNGLGRPAFTATMVDILGPDKRMRGMNLNYWAINIGFSVAAILAGVLAHAPHMTVFLMNAVTQLAMAALVFTLVPETTPAVKVEALRVPGNISDVFKDRVFMAFVLLNLGLWVIIETCKLIPIAMHQRGLDPADYGTVIAVNGIMIVAFQLFVPKLIKARKRNSVLTMAAILVGIGMGSVAVAGTVPLLMLTVVVWTAGEMLHAPVSGALIADLSRTDMRGRYQGVASMGFTLANFVSPVLGGMLLDHAPAPTLWVVMAALGVVVAIGQWLSGPARERRAASLTQKDHHGVRVEAISA
ncbi:MDR family MFS transporter [Catelliglobosispora koreensis]|uniref:MDR family MFS transporter n=1 Tax=Catelliglobosispora koreensis TaxID=129052 RepID=UPI00036D6E17|nr:MFS transporter [Catelliglobosispora koreensis]